MPIARRLALLLALDTSALLLAQAPTGLVGIRAGDPVASFVPWHVTGQSAGKTACPLCVFGQRPGVALWTTPAALATAVPVARALDAALAELNPRDAVGYVVLLADPHTPRDAAARALRDEFAGADLQSVFLTIADRDANAADLAEYHLTTDPAASLIGYVNRTAAFVWHEPDAARLAELAPTLRNLSDAQEPYAESAVRLCSKAEPGEPLEIYGRVRNEHGQPLARASVIAYATDAEGRYVPAGTPRAQRLPRLRAVAVTDDDGFYRFATVRPGPYPDRDDPAHVHLHIDAAVHQHTYRTLWFEGDPRITPKKRAALDGETVIVTLRKRDDGTLVCRHDVQLVGS